VVSGIPGCSNCGLQEVTEWINSDAHDPGFQIMTDDKIIENVWQEADEYDDNDEEEVVEESESAPSHHEAFSCLDTAKKWHERHQERDEV
jgi:hypothetical protein